jgi:hypothetical protein
VIKKLKLWWAKRKAVANSEMQIYVSRKTTLPLELCTVENLRTAASYDFRQAKRYRKTGKPNHEATAEWYQMAANTLYDLAETLEEEQERGKDIKVVEDLPPKKRRETIEILKRMRTGKA